MSGFAVIPADTLVVADPRLARVLTRGLDAEWARYRANGWDWPDDFAELRVALDVMSRPPEPAVSAVGTIVDVECADGRRWLTAKATAGVVRLGVRRVTGLAQAGVLRARKSERDVWLIDEESAMEFARLRGVA